MRMPQTFSRIIERVTTCPAFRQRYSSSTNSCGVPQRLRSACGLAPQQVEFGRSCTRSRVARRRRRIALQQIAQPGQQLRQGKGLGQVIVAALFEPTHAIN